MRPENAHAPASSFSDVEDRPVPREHPGT